MPVSPRQPLPTRDARLRAQDFLEVATGYDRGMAIREAERCLQCRHRPCVGGCPVGIDIPGFIRAIAQGDMPEAYRVLAQDTALPAVCGRVCPQESQCEGRCVLGIKGEPVAIGNLERFAADTRMQEAPDAPKPIAANGHRVAVVGAGPSGLTAAGELAKMGYQVTLFEALHEPGGVLTYGIPAFRLPKDIVRREVAGLAALGVDIQCNMVIGKTLLPDELFQMGYEALYIASGAGLPKFMGIPGESLNGVYSANEYLTRINLMRAWQEDAATPIFRGGRVAVVGGGNVAMDAARSALRLGADQVTIVYRRGMAELPARLEEVHHAQEEGIQFRTLCAPTAVLGEGGWVKGLACVEMTLGEPDASGRRRPIEKLDSAFTLPIDTLIMAIGTAPNPLLHRNTPGLKTDQWGCLVADEKGLTTKPLVWAGGDAVTGAATVILAMGAGKTAARAIDEALSPP
ncbi:MAG: NADPH-dependent glutamate synthase [Christensenellales bacterium]